MKITIQPPLFLNETGRRDNNEDSIFSTVTEDIAHSQPVFLVCDGVGGAERGEIASGIVAEGFGTFFQNCMADQATIAEALDSVQTQLDEYLDTNPEARGMGTTMTFLQLHGQGATIAHIGDSRVYHLRGSQILFQTEDHSLVNEMKKQGVPVDESAKSNVITRAVQGHSVRKVAADVHFISDIQPNDYFFLCSDGIWEAFSNADLQDLAQAQMSNQEKVAIIQKACVAKSRDNYSAYWIKIDTVEAGDEGDNIADNTANNVASKVVSHEVEKEANNVSQMHPTPAVTTTTADVEASPQYSSRNIAVEDTNKPRKNAWLVPLLLLIVLAIIGFFVWQTLLKTS